MRFYEELSRYYDEIFPVNAAEMAFVAGLVRGRGPLLDIGCGTGNKTALLTGGGEATGIDSEPGMIDAARNNNAAPGITYEVLGMEGIAARFAPASFGSAVCLGNTLPHLVAPGTIERLCANVHAILAPGGLFVCQILNYARILDANITELPLIDTEHTRFSRRYVKRGGLLGFVTELHLKAENLSLEHEVPLYPLRPEELHAHLARAGFTEQTDYGSYEGAAFTDSSFVLIRMAVSRRG